MQPPTNWFVIDYDLTQMSTLPWGRNRSHEATLIVYIKIIVGGFFLPMDQNCGEGFPTLPTGLMVTHLYYCSVDGDVAGKTGPSPSPHHQNRQQDRWPSDGLSPHTSLPLPPLATRCFFRGVFMAQCNAG